jgi:hypothetical protein
LLKLDQEHGGARAGEPGGTPRRCSEVNIASAAIAELEDVTTPATRDDGRCGRHMVRSRHTGSGELVGMFRLRASMWKKSSVVVVIVAVAVVAACSRSASSTQAPTSEPKPEPESSVVTKEDERAAVATLEAELRASDPSIAVVAEETVERDGQILPQYRITTPSTRLPVGIDSPTIIMYSLIDKPSGSREVAEAVIDAVGKAKEMIPELMMHGQIAIKPVAVYFAVKPGRKVRIWAGGLVEPLLIRDRDRLQHDLGAVAVPETKEPIVIGIVYPAKGQRVNAFDVPMPPDWTAAQRQAGRPLKFPEELFAIVWPD